MFCLFVSFFSHLSISRQASRTSLLATPTTNKLHLPDRCKSSPGSPNSGRQSCSGMTLINTVTLNFKKTKTRTKYARKRTLNNNLKQKNMYTKREENNNKNDKTKRRKGKKKVERKILIFFSYFRSIWK
jgi:hypothetical protein